MGELQKIRLLPPEIVHRIAAGEIVDKPASILKELVENSVDAGSKRIQVTFVEGGVRSIQVDDDGHGITRENLEVCVQRHATSKISAIEELDAIPLLGFRGEALSAAASVSRLTIDTSTEADGAWVLQVTGGVRSPLRPGARKRGTRVTLEDLFFNVPARRKFLRKPGLEAQDCIDTLESLSLAHPGVEFVWSAVDDKGEVKEQQFLKAGTLMERFRNLIDLEAEGLELKADAPAPGVRKLEVALFKPPAASHVMKSVRLTVNGRPIQDKRLPYVAREAFVGLIEVGRFPHVQVAVEVDPTIIDVNIHPQKKEIRWSSGFNLGSLVYKLIRDGLSAHSKMANTHLESGDPSEFPVAAHANRPAEFIQESLLSTGGEPATRAGAAPSFAGQMYSPMTTRPPFRFAELKVLGEALASWIVCESPQGIIIIDQHAAHERINFEKQMSRMNLVRAKPLFIPIRFKLPLSMKGSEPELRAALEKVGFEVADAGILPSGEMEIIAVPESDRKVKWEELVEEIIEDLKSGENSTSVADRLQVRVAASLACHGSVRRGQRLSNEEIRPLLNDLDAIEWGGLCPHGRPVWFLLSNGQIENLFHR